MVSNLLLSPKFRAIRHRHIFRRPSLGSKVGRSLAAAGKAEQMKLQYPSQMAGGTCAIQALRHHPSSGTPFFLRDEVASAGGRQREQTRRWSPVEFNLRPLAPPASRVAERVSRQVVHRGCACLVETPLRYWACLSHAPSSSHAAIGGQQPARARALVANNIDELQDSWVRGGSLD